MENPVIGTRTGAAVMVGTGRIPLDKRHLYTEFRQTPIHVALAGAGAAVGSANTVNVLHVPSLGAYPGAGFKTAIKGTQTILGPAETDVGLDIGMDQTNNDGLEIDTGITARNPLAFVVGTDAFYLHVEATIADASGADPFHVGFRKLAARAGDYNDYTDFACIGAYAGGGAGSDPATIYLETALNNVATIQTNTTNTWADAAKKKFSVFVDVDGNVTYKINDAAPTVVTAYKFDTGDTVMPFIFFLHGTDVAGTVELSLFDCGLQ
jgi:hypothetical protein